MRLRTACAAAGLLAQLLPTAARSATPAELLAQLGFPADALAQVKAGGIVRADLTPSHERELAVGLAFQVAQPPEKLFAELREGLLVKLDPNVEAHGTLSGDGTPAELQGFESGELLDAYRSAQPGAALNLSSAEIQALRALRDASAEALASEVRTQLLERYRSYRRAGLDGIASYDRGEAQRSGASDLRSAVQAGSVVAAVLPRFHDTLLHYPRVPDSGFQEVFRWERYRAHGEPALILIHAFSIEEAEGLAVAQRQYYVSSSYNVEQALAYFLAVPEGTLVIYGNRTSSDQLAGFGSGAKRSIGRQLMAAQLESLFAALQRAAAQP